DYMAPEQAVDPRSADARADVYSLGCTLYHLLTGRPPFPGGSLTQKLLRHQQEEPADPARLRASLPAGPGDGPARGGARRPRRRGGGRARARSGRRASRRGRRSGRPAAAAAALEPYCSAAHLKTLPAPDPPPPTDAAVTPAPSRPSPVSRLEPQGTATYDLVD